MRRIDIIKRAGRNLRQAKARTALTALAMSVGAFTIGVALMLGNGGRAFLTTVIESAGSASTVYVTQPSCLNTARTRPSARPVLSC